MKKHKWVDTHKIENCRVILYINKESGAEPTINLHYKEEKKAIVVSLTIPYEDIFKDKYLRVDLTETIGLYVKNNIRHFCMPKN